MQKAQSFWLHALAAGVLAALLGALGTASARPEVGRRSYVITSIAKLRKEPSATAEVVGTLRIGRETEELARRGSWRRIRTATEEGWVSGSVLGRSRPTLEDLLARAHAAKNAKAKKRWLERATALAPSDLEVIAELLAAHRELGRKDAAHFVDKGLIAAERRALSWDGPLYVIREQTALLPRACFDEGERKNGRTSRREVLRGRAFPLVASGKVVAVTETGYRTQVLDEPVCVPSACGGEQAGFRLPHPAREGALVPSWLVAGHRVVPYVVDKAPADDAAGEQAPRRHFIDEQNQTRLTVDDARWRLSLHTLDGWHDLDEQPAPLPGAVPVAQLSEDEDRLMILWKAPGQRACCAGGGRELQVWLTRTTGLSSSAPRAATGRLYSGGYQVGCEQERFTGLPGEPRCERLAEGCELEPPGLSLP